jgi:5-methylcytosine-specific restriction endonuclease McrA
VDKRCASCGITKVAEAFYQSKSSKSGLHGWCKDCARQKAKAVYERQDSVRKREQRKRARRERLERERAEYRQLLTHKICTKCKINKPVADFSKSNNGRGRTGLHSWCKECHRIRSAERRKSRTFRDPDPNLTHKRCTRCGERQPVSQFAACRTSQDGYTWQCRGCQRAYDQARYWAAAKDASPVPNHRDLRLINARRRIAHQERRFLRAAQGVFDVIEKDLRRLANTPCAFCGSTIGLQIDHIVPISRGGRHSVGNLQSLCKPCNSSKNNRLEVEWRYGFASFTHKRAI